MNTNFKTLLETHHNMLKQLSELNNALEGERMKNVRTNQDLKILQLEAEGMKDIVLDLEMLKKEKGLLEDENRKLRESQLSESERKEIEQYEEEIRRLREDSDRYKTSAKKTSQDLQTCKQKYDAVQDKLKFETLEKEQNSLRAFELSQENQVLKEKLNVLLADGIDLEDLQKAILLVRKRKEACLPVDFDGISPEVRRELEDLKSVNTNLIRDFDSLQASNSLLESKPSFSFFLSLLSRHYPLTLLPIPPFQQKQNK